MTGPRDQTCQVARSTQPGYQNFPHDPRERATRDEKMVERAELSLNEQRPGRARYFLSHVSDDGLQDARRRPRLADLAEQVLEARGRGV